MLKDHKIAVFLLLLLLVIFLAGVYKLFVMRFEVGDVYPVYSSLRADPLGTKIFFDSLVESGLEVRRNYRWESHLSYPEDRTYFLMGVRQYELNVPETEARRLDRMVTGGSRLVVMLYPEGPSKASTGSKAVGKTRKKGSVRGKRDLYAPKLVSLPEHWGFKIRTLEVGESTVAEASGKTAPSNPSVLNPRKAMTADSEKGISGLPEKVSWHSCIFFSDCGKGWKILYEVNGNPVMIERHLGSGEIVIASDSYLVSNEAMFRERHPALLSFLVGNSAAVVFDESHLGIIKNPGVMALIIKYHLGGLMAGLVVLGALFIWKNATSLVPPRRDPDRKNDSIQGMDNISGLVNLMKRNIPLVDLPEVCYSEWKKTHLNNSLITHEGDMVIQATIRQEKSLPHNKKDPVRAYKTIEKILSERGQGK